MAERVRREERYVADDVWEKGIKPNKMCHGGSKALSLAGEVSGEGRGGVPNPNPNPNPP